MASEPRPQTRTGSMSWEGLCRSLLGQPRHIQLHGIPLKLSVDRYEVALWRARLCVTQDHGDETTALVIYNDPTLNAVTLRLYLLENNTPLDSPYGALTAFEVHPRGVSTNKALLRAILDKITPEIAQALAAPVTA